MKFATLDHLWWGVSIGGRHYTGEVTIDDVTTEMIRKLSLKEAKEYADEKGLLWLRKQRETNEFETLESLERHALKFCEKEFKDEPEWALFEYDYWNPRRLIGGKGYIVDRKDTINAVAKAWDKVRDHCSEEEWNAYTEAWKTLVYEK